MRYAIQAVLAVATLAAAPPARAEPGDYSALQTAINLVSPPRADSRVTPAQRTGPYPLLSNPAGFADGFSRGKYIDWQTIRLHPSTGAVCGNGSPYKIFVSRVPNTRNTLFYFEGGGACWDFESCTGRVPGQGYRNSGGIPDDYMQINQLTTPFIFRLHPYDRVKTQNWNLVYVPYCTGDIYTGDRVAVYTNPQDANDQVVLHHNGLRNVRAAIAWVKDNLPRATQLVSTGCSAGGVASITNYHHLRRDMAPDRGFLINDSGPIFPAPTAASTAQYPSIPLHRQIRGAWGLDSGMLSIYAAEVPGFDRENMGTLNASLANRWPADRMGHVHFWDDLIYSKYSYARFYDDVRNEPDAAVRAARLLDRWRVDTENLRVQLAGIANVGGYFPRFRSIVDSHCATIVDFADGDIQEQNLELRDFVNSVLNGSGKVLDASESDTIADRAKPFNLLYWLINNGEALFGRVRDLIAGVFS
jgi:hypothetical protein